MSNAREQLLREMEAAWQEFRGQLRNLDYSLDWKAKPLEPEEWCARDIIAHLLGNTRQSLLATVRMALAEENPTVELRGSSPFRSPETRAMQLPELVAQVDTLYREALALVTSLRESDLSRKLTIRRADGSLQERTCLEMVQRTFCRHWRDHARQVARIREELGVAEL